MLNMLVISGPPCSGKTYFINNTIKSDTKILDLLSFNENHKAINANQLRSLSNSSGSSNSLTTNHGELVVHYDSMRSYKRDLGTIDINDAFIQYILQHSCVKVVLMLCPLNVMYDRMYQRYQRLNCEISETRKSKLEKMLALYQNKERYIGAYMMWYDFLKANGINHLFFYFNNYQNSKDVLLTSNNINVRHTLQNDEIVLK